MADRDPGSAAMRVRDLFTALRPSQGGLVELVDRRGPRLRLIHLGEVAQQAGRLLDRPPLTVFWESGTGCLRVTHRELVLRFAGSVPESRRRAILAEGGCTVLRVNPFIPDQVVVSRPEKRPAGDELIALANRWMEMEEVLFATPSFLSEYRRQAPPAVRPEEWHLRSTDQSMGADIRVTAAWKRTMGEPDIVVAVLDDGVDLEHPNLAPNLWWNPDPMAPDRVGRDFSSAPGEPGHFDPRPKRFASPFDDLDRNDIHGTPCAGLVVATGVGGGSVGVAPGCRVLPVKIFRGNELACDEGVANAIRYAALHADILSCSWSGGFGPDVELALEDAGTLGRRGRGTAIFCAAGNGRGAPVAFPACDPSSVAVGASTDLGTWAEYANRGPEISLVAPSSGGIRRIFTTDISQPGRGFAPGDTHTDQFGGTSASAAITAGVGALVLSVHPGLERGELKDLLEQTADKIGGGYNARGHSQEFGFGRVNAGWAVEEAAWQAGRAQQPVSSKRGYSERACSTRPLSCCRPPRSS